MSRIAVIGAGAWGTALALVLGRGQSHEVTLWAFEKEVCESIATKRRNSLFLPDFEIPENVSVTNSLPTAVDGAQIALTVMPSHHARRLFEQMRTALPANITIVSATKGVENNTHKRMTEIAEDVTDVSRLAALSGPSFAKEVARGDPTAVTVAATNPEVAAYIQREFSDSTFRVYTSDDVIGVELGGALKNVIAIAAGIVEGLNLGHNSAAALITRGLAEMTRLAVACGARRETLSGLSGMGDLVLTCTGGLSRNRTVGVQLGQGRKLPDIMAGMHGMVAEGVSTTDAALGLARRHRIEMPITEQVHLILHEEKSPKDAIRELMNRPGKEE